MMLDRAILRSASWLVPAAQRAEWLAEWSAELCYVTRGGTQFCLGAYRDALWLRRDARAPVARRLYALDSPRLCLLLLATLALGSGLLAFRLPFARSMVLPSPYADPARLAILGWDGRLGSHVPTLTVERYRFLAAHRSGAFAAVAVYRPMGAHAAVGSSNLLEVLGTASAIPGGEAWRLPGNAETWRFEDAKWFDALPPHTKVFVVGRLREPAAGRFRVSVFDAAGGEDHFECWSLVPDHALVAYLIMLVAALLTLSTTNHLSLGEYPANRHSLRRWLFLAAKLLLVLAIIACGSLDVASLTSPGLYPTTWLVGLVVGLRWAIVDQRRRCPECLRPLSNPTRIGGASQVFLEWYGTELVCGRGHGLLYVPEVVTSCYSTQRWQYLDASWSSIFSLKNEPEAGVY